MNERRDSNAVRLHLTPVGKGNWKTAELVLVCRHSPPPMLLRRGERVQIGAHTYRISAVLPG